MHILTTDRRETGREKADTDRQTDKQTGKQTDKFLRQTNTQTSRKTDRQTDRWKYEQRDRHDERTDGNLTDGNRIQLVDHSPLSVLQLVPQIPLNMVVPRGLSPRMDCLRSTTKLSGRTLCYGKYNGQRRMVGLLPSVRPLGKWCTAQDVLLSQIIQKAINTMKHALRHNNSLDHLLPRTQ